MASFTWLQGAAAGCPLCGTSVEERGFVDCIADTLVRNAEGEVTGVVDLFICAKCVEQMARLVGSMTQAESMQMVNLCTEYQTVCEKLKDEIAAHQERYDNLLNNLSSDLSSYLKEKQNDSVKRKSSSEPSS